jgi:hypothetical protein
MPSSWSESNRLHSTRMREDAADYSIHEDADKYEGDYENDAPDDSYLDGAFDAEFDGSFDDYAEDRYLDSYMEDRYYAPEADFDIY